MSRKLLIVTYAYSPAISPRAFRWSALAEYWAAHGHQVDVVSAWELGWPRHELLNGVTVYRVHSDLLQKVRGWFQRAGTPGTNQSPSADQPKASVWLKGKIKGAALQGYHRVYRKLCWPDPYFFWYTAGLKQANALLRIAPEYDALISVSQYFTAHLVASRLHRSNPALRWLVDIGDPFSFLEIDAENNFFLYRGLNHRVERSIFQRANAISVTTVPTRDRYATIFPESASKIHVIPPLLSPAQSNPAVQPFFSSDHKIRLVYTGMLHDGNRRPDFLLKLFTAQLNTALADALELHILGDIRHARSSFEPYEALLGKKIFLHGRVSREQSTQALQEANVLVNVGNKTSYQLPSKVVEYVSTGKPILNLSQIENDSSALFFKAYPAVLNLLDTQAPDLKNKVDALYQFIVNLPPPVEPALRRQLIAPFEIESIAAAYDRILWAYSTE